MKRLTLLLTYVLSIVFAFSSFAEEKTTNLKDQVAIVTPNISEEMKKHASEMVRIMANYSYYSAASEYKAYQKGWSGSGFVIKGKNGRHYIVTNKHVTRGLKSVNIEFNGDTATKYEDCPVIKESEEIDVAIVELPRHFKIGQSLEFYTETVNEGDDVWSAGYPGLGNNPVWQLGKGIISNMSVRDKDFGDEKKFHVIQHTAQVDAGNSGGPLLIRKEKKGSAPSYYVIGVNTWKAGGRENTNFSIPTKFINEFVSQAITEATNISEQKQEENVKAAGENFYNALLSGYKEIIPFLSDECTYSITNETFQEMFSQASSEVQTEIRENLKEAKGTEALKILLADNLAQSVKKKKQTLTLKETKLSGTGATAISTFSYNGKEKIFNWANEHGQWKIVSNGSDSNGGSFQMASGVHIIKNKGKGLATSALFGLNDYSKLNITLSINRYFATLGMRSVTFFAGKDIIARNEIIEGTYEERTIPGDTIFIYGIKYNIGVRVPIGFGEKFALTPYVLPGGGISTETFFWNIRSGVNFGWRYDKKHQLYLGAEYNFTRGMENNTSQKVTRPFAGVVFGWDY